MFSINNRYTGILILCIVCFWIKTLYRIHYTVLLFLHCHYFLIHSTPVRLTISKKSESLYLYTPYPKSRAPSEHSNSFEYHPNSSCVSMSASEFSQLPCITEQLPLFYHLWFWNYLNSIYGREVIFALTLMAVSHFLYQKYHLKIIFVSTKRVITYFKCINFRLVMAIIISQCCLESLIRIISKNSS